MALPDHLPDLLDRALNLHRAGRPAEAAELYRGLIAAGGECAVDARVNLAVLLDEQGRHEEALLFYGEALSLREGDPLALNNMGNSLLKLGRFAEAAARFAEAVSRAPGFPEARLGLGAALQRSGEVAQAVACFRDIVRLDPGCAEGHWNLSLALLLAGEYREGWAEYQWRWRRESFTSPIRRFAEPTWDGSPLAGRRILVHGEQGFGDTLQFARYLPMVAREGGVVVAECQSPALAPLLRLIPGVSEVAVMGEPLPPFDLQVPLLSLPHLFDTTLDNVPDRVPYLLAPPERLPFWRDRVAGDRGFKVGLAWAGKPVPDPFRSCTLQALLPLADIPGVTLYSLQVGDGAANADERGALVDLTGSIADFGDTAALISQLDLVISIDTSVAHLAGGLASPTWLLLPRAGDYRWLLSRDDSPWYPTMRLFRQKVQGEWGEVVQRLRAELEEACRVFLERGAAAHPFDGWRHHLCGLHLSARGREREATPRFTKAAQLLPRSWEPHYALAGALQRMGRIAEAGESLEAALALAPEEPRLHEALGIVRQMQGDCRGAVASYREALRLDPAAVKARYNLASSLQESGRFAEALEEFREVVLRSPGHANAHWNLAVLSLMTGDFASGWREFPWRFKKSPDPPARRWQDHPQWDGSPLAGRTILLWGEQGAGDTLQFVRYAPLVAGLGGRVLVELQSQGLIPLLSFLPGIDGLFAAGEALPPFDLQASLMELPALFGTGLSSVPGEVPYLAPDPGRVEALRPLVPEDGSLRVGLVWRGNPAHSNDANRSLAPEELGLLSGIPGVTFYSLQFDDGSASPLPPLPVTDLAPQIREFSDTAALASLLDLVVSVDTSVAHLCGALAVPTWLLVPFVPDWRWLLSRDDSPWYPTLRLFRQRGPGEWDGVLARVREALVRAAAEPVPRRGDRLRGDRLRGDWLRGDWLRRCLSPSPAVSPSPGPARAELLNNDGCALDNAGRHLEAIELYREAASLDGLFAAPQYNMGNSLSALGRVDEAIACYRRAVEIDPALPQGWHNLALSLQGKGCYDEAQRALERAAGLAPDYLEARHNLGELLHARGDLEGAAALFRENLCRDPGYLPSLNALGIALQVQGRLEEAVRCYREALALKPDYLHALNNLGAASRALGHLERAVECYRKVLALDPEYADAHWNLGLVQLQLGRYREGWEGYEWRFKKVDPIPRLELPRPLWDGSPLAGRTILLHAEQGFGDTFQFVRYATLLAQGGTVLVQCQSGAIAPVVATVPGVARVLSRGEPLPDFDCHAPLMSLPHLCGTLLDTVPAGIPYLLPDPRLVESWRKRLCGPGFKVGLVWAGRKSYKDDLKRSLSLPLFAPLASVPGVRLYSLQVGDGAEQAASPPAGMELIDLGREIGNFADTAAIMAQLDLVITADSAPAHLAGGLGLPFWVLLPMACDWRWLLEREDSPWYPTARLFRQKRRGDWEEVLERVALGLAELVAAKGRPR